MFRTRGKLLLVPGWRGVYDQVPSESKSAAEEDEGADQQLPKLAEDEEVQTLEIASERKETKPPRRYSDASLLGAMETAGKLVDDDELREAMKDSGIGTPATRAAIIERLIQVGYIEREGRSLVCTEKGLNVIRLLGEHALTSPDMTGQWEHRLDQIERGEDSRKQFMGDIAGFAEETVKELDATFEGCAHPSRQSGPVPDLWSRHHREPQGFLMLGAQRPGLRFRDLEGQAGKQLSVAIASELIRSGQTAKAVTGLKVAAAAPSAPTWRSARTRRANGAEFNEPWAREGAKPPEAEAEAGEAARREEQAVAASGCLAEAAQRVGSVREDGRGADHAGHRARQLGQGKRPAGGGARAHSPR